MKTPEQMAEEYAEEKSRADYIGSDGEWKWYRSGRGSFSRVDFLAGYQAAKPQWISVKERLPEGGKVVLVAMPKGTVTLGGIHKKTQTFDVFLDMAICTAEPTHWMPLPEPPKED